VKCTYGTSFTYVLDDNIKMYILIKLVLSIVLYIGKDVRTFSARFLTETSTTIFYRGVSLRIQKMSRGPPDTHSM
jgi:hypothetical protein